MVRFRVRLDDYLGPLDLLLYLVRRHELDIVEIPIAQITEQFLQFLDVLNQLDVDEVGEFLAVASTLVEIKSRMVLPNDGEETEQIDDPRQDLVKRLLEYKEIRDAADMLEVAAISWQQRFGRQSVEFAASSGRQELSEQPIHDVEIWDLVSAFRRLSRDKVERVDSNIVYDDTPLEVYIQNIHTRVREVGRVQFSKLYPAAAHRSTMVGILLAILELIRYGQVNAKQSELFGEIWLEPGKCMTDEFDLTRVVA